MSQLNSTESEVAGNSPSIAAMAAELRAIDAAFSKAYECDSDEISDHLNDCRWELRARIAEMQSKSWADIAIKSSIFEAEATRDGEFECHAPGSARDLARSIAADVLALSGARVDA